MVALIVIEFFDASVSTRKDDGNNERYVSFILLDGVETIVDEFVSRLLLVGSRSSFTTNERATKEKLDIQIHK